MSRASKPDQKLIRLMDPLGHLLSRYHVSKFFKLCPPPLKQVPFSKVAFKTSTF